MASVKILWPSRVPPAIEEIRYAYRFCRTISMERCLSSYLTLSWLDYTEDDSIADAILGAEEELILLVTDPEIVLTDIALKRMMNTIVSSGSTACVPVYNQSEHTCQIADLPYRYLSIGTFLETAELLARLDSRRKTVEGFDPACVLYNRVRLAKALGRSAETRKGVLGAPREVTDALLDGGALVHTFKDGFFAEREDLVSLVPDSVRRVLDIGCAMGGYGRCLKRLRPDIRLMGVELNAAMAKNASPHYDGMIHATVEDAKIEETFDLINCGDLLEHLKDPWNMLQRFREMLTPKGYLVISVPNAGHWTIVKDLLAGEFRYLPLGLLCVTHLRWFTESSIRRDLMEAGFAIDVFQKEQIPPTRQGTEFIEELCATGYGDLDTLSTNEFIVRAVRK